MYRNELVTICDEGLSVNNLIDYQGHAAWQKPHMCPFVRTRTSEWARHVVPKRERKTQNVVSVVATAILDLLSSRTKSARTRLLANCTCRTSRCMSHYIFIIRVKSALAIYDVPRSSSQWSSPRIGYSISVWIIHRICTPSWAHCQVFRSTRSLAEGITFLMHIHHTGYHQLSIRFSHSDAKVFFYDSDGRRF